MTERQYIEAEGATLEEALRRACQELGASRSEVEYRYDREHFRTGADTVRLQVRLKDPEVVRALRFGREYVQGIIDRAGLKGTVDVRMDDGKLRINIRSKEDGNLLIGRDGKTLEALEHVVGKAAVRVDPQLRVAVDVEEYRGRREEALRELALDAIDEVRRLRKPVTLRPMNSYERRIVHLEVMNAPGVGSRSVGQGSMKRLQIFPT